VIVRLTAAHFQSELSAKVIAMHYMANVTPIAAAMCDASADALVGDLAQHAFSHPPPR